jgi:hypothetical protein
MNSPLSGISSLLHAVEEIEKMQQAPQDQIQVKEAVVKKEDDQPQEIISPEDALFNELKSRLSHVTPSSSFTEEGISVKMQQKSLHLEVTEAVVKKEDSQLQEIISDEDALCNSLQSRLSLETDASSSAATSSPNVSKKETVQVNALDPECMLPESVTYVTFGPCYNQLTDKLPESVTKITFGPCYNQLTDKQPASVTKITFGEDYNKP